MGTTTAAAGAAAGRPVYRVPPVENANLVRGFILDGCIVGVATSKERTKVFVGAGSSSAGMADEENAAMKTLECVRHLGTPKLLNDVDSLTRNQMRSFLESLGCKRVSWKCEVLRKQIRAVIEARGSGKEGKDDLRKAAEAAHFTQREMKRMAIDKIQKICLPSQGAPKKPRPFVRDPRVLPEVGTEVARFPAAAASPKNQSQQTSYLPLKKRVHLQENRQDGGGSHFHHHHHQQGAAQAASTSSTTCTDSDQMEPHAMGALVAAAESKEREAEISAQGTKVSTRGLAADVDNLTRNQMRGFLHKLGLEKVSWKCETLKQQIKAVLEAKGRGVEKVSDLKEVAVTCGIVQAIDSIQRSFDTDRKQEDEHRRQSLALLKGNAGMEEVGAASSAHQSASVLGVSPPRRRQFVRGDESTHSEIVKKLETTIKGNRTGLDNLLMNMRTSKDWHGAEEQKALPKGVMYSQSTGKFEASNYFLINKKLTQVFLGHFDTAAAAAKSYDLSVLSHMKEELRELVKLKDPRTKQSIRQVLGLNNPFEMYENIIDL